MLMAGAVPLLLVMLGGGTYTTVSASSGSPAHIMVVMEENEGYSQIIGSSYAPYLTSLASQYASATQWYSAEHVSGSDYRDLVSGFDTQSPPPTEQTIADELNHAGLPWKAYLEDMPSNCYTGSSSTDGTYDAHHNPFKWAKDYRSLCNNLTTGGVVPFPSGGPSGFISGLDSANPDYVWVTPDTCDDMHGDYSSPTSPCRSLKLGTTAVQAADTWLKSYLGAVLHSSWFADNGIVIITWDEGLDSDSSGWVNGAFCPSSCGGGRIPTLVISASDAHLANHNFTTGGNTFGVLRGIEEAFGLGLLGHAASTGNGDLRPAFG